MGGQTGFQARDLRVLLGYLLSLPIHVVLDLQDVDEDLLGDNAQGRNIVGACQASVGQDVAEWIRKDELSKPSKACVEL